jgi:uncharacterized protein (DUF305 family)
MMTPLRLAAFVVLICAASSQGLNGSFQTRASEQEFADPSWKDLNASMERMHSAVTLVKSSGSSDIDFARFMLAHHQAAIDMAKTQLTYGKDAEMRRLAQEIITDQHSEIELMQLWLKRHESKK